MSKLQISGCVLVLSLCCSVLLGTAEQVTDPSEVKTLVDVKRSLIDPLGHLNNWNKGDPCTSKWTGVLCHDAPLDDGYLHVQALHLLNMNLSGSLAPALGQLSNLHILDFMWNEISGTIPKEIGNITTLQLLLLNGNKLFGSLPDELGNLSYLNRLQVDQNQISGPLPKSLANMSSIRHIHLNNNSISGQIPAELSNLSSLLHLLLDNNHLSGSLPSQLSVMADLRILQFDNNNFDGAEIPASYGNFPRLVKLSLRNCSLEGSIPDLSGIKELSYLDLSRNRLRGPVPSNRLSNNMTTIDLSDNSLNGSIPASFSDLPLLQNLSLANNMFNGSIPARIWQNITFTKGGRLTIDLQNNLLSKIDGELNPPENVTLRLGGNPICTEANILGISLYCGINSQGNGTQGATNSKSCPIYGCPTDNFYEYVPAFPECFCASPIRIGYRLKSPSFSYFNPYVSSFEEYVTRSLGMQRYQLFIYTYAWEQGPRLRMYLKLFPVYGRNSSLFNETEVARIKGIFASWRFPGSDFFGPYELLNFTLVGPYSTFNSPSQKTGVSKGFLAAIVVGAVASCIVISALILLLILRRYRYQPPLSSSRKKLSAKISMRIEGVKAFTFRELALATDSFSKSTQVGQGGYGKVYKGILWDNSVVAIKRAEEGSLQGQKEFLTEIKLLSRLHHRNLVSLIGYCDEEEEQMLVYEYMPNGTLRDWLSGKGKRYLDLSMRLPIALGSAKGILYLHTEANPPVFHRDIKASNILLDSKLTAKVADFGLSRLAPVLDGEGEVPHHVSTVVKGTPGYLDPEYFLTHKLTDKSDVYSLGVVFLELLTGMQPISHGKNIVREVNMAHESGMIFSIIDSKMGSYPSECVERFVALALMCCCDKPEKRPSILDVVRELETILKMMPDTTEDAYWENVHSGSGKSLASSSSYTSRDPYFSSNVSGSDLISGVVPTVTPR